MDVELIAKAVMRQIAGRAGFLCVSATRHALSGGRKGGFNPAKITTEKKRV